MDVTAAGTANGTKVQLYDCNGTGAQDWQRGHRRTAWSTPAPASAWTPPDQVSANGTRLQIWACAGGANQQFGLPA